MKITIIGAGYVGLTTGLSFANKNHQVTIIDLNSKKINDLNNNIEPFYEKGIKKSMLELKKNLIYTTDISTYNLGNIFFLAVPTPSKKDGSLNLKFINNVIGDFIKIRKVSEKFLIVIKSTVPIGTNKIIQNLLAKSNLNGEVASNPEFLSQSTALWDSLNPHRIIIGTQSTWAKKILEKIFKNFNSPILNMSLESAELVKYTSNTFQALKISFINEVANISEMIGANIDDVALGMSYDPIIGNKFLSSGIGYGGSCFPKDTKSLAKQAKSVDVNPLITNAIIATNASQINKIIKLISNETGPIGILGLTFKPETDDTRETPAHYIIEKLNSKKIIPMVYDPQGMNNYQKMFPEDKVVFANSTSELIANSNNILLVTAWAEFKSLTKNDFKGKKVFDGRRIYKFAHYQIGSGFKKNKQ